MLRILSRLYGQVLCVNFSAQACNALEEAFKKLEFRPEFRPTTAAKWSLSLTDFAAPPQFVKKDVSLLPPDEVPGVLIADP